MLARSRNGNHLVNLQHAVEIGRSGSESFAVMADGRVIALADELTAIEIMAEVQGVVPAASGYEALRFHGELDADVSETFVQREPVLAWSVCGQGAMAVTTDADMKPVTIKRPDGSVTDPWDQDWDSEDEWLADMHKRHEAARLRRAAMRSAKADEKSD